MQPTADTAGRPFTIERIGLLQRVGIDDKITMSIHVPRLRTASAIIVAALWVAGAAPAGAHGPIHEQIQAMSARILREPANAELYLRRGELYRAHRAWVQGLADYAKAARLDARLDAVDLCRGLLLFDAGRLQEAKKALNRFLVKNPDHARGLIARARVLVRLDRRGASAEDFRRAIANAPAAPPEHYLEFANALADAGRVDAAIGALDAGVAALGDLIALHERAIELERRRGRFDAAIARLDRAWASVHRKETWLIRRGDLLRQAGKLTEARAAYVQSLVAIAALQPRQRQVRAVAALETHARTRLGAFGPRRAER